MARNKYRKAVYFGNAEQDPNALQDVDLEPRDTRFDPVSSPSPTPRSSSPEESDWFEPVARTGYQYGGEVEDDEQLQPPSPPTAASMDPTALTPAGQSSAPVSPADEGPTPAEEPPPPERPAAAKPLRAARPKRGRRGRRRRTGYREGGPVGYQDGGEVESDLRGDLEGGYSGGYAAAQSDLRRQEQEQQFADWQRSIRDALDYDRAKYRIGQEPLGYNQQPPDIESYYHGRDALPPDQLDAHLQRIASANPDLSEGALNYRAVTDAGDLDTGSKVMAGLRNRANSFNTLAQGAAGSGDYATATQLARRGHDNVPDGNDISFNPARNGNIDISVRPTFGAGEESRYSLTPDQFHNYLVGPATDFDHIMENGIRGNLDIATRGLRGDITPAELGAPVQEARNQPYGVSKPSSTEQARADIAASRAVPSTVVPTPTVSGATFQPMFPGVNAKDRFGNPYGITTVAPGPAAAPTIAPVPSPATAPAAMALPVETTGYGIGAPKISEGGQLSQPYAAQLRTDLGRLTSQGIPPEGPLPSSALGMLLRPYTTGLRTAELPLPSAPIGERVLGTVSSALKQGLGAVLTPNTTRPLPPSELASATDRLYNPATGNYEPMTAAQRARYMGPQTPPTPDVAPRFYVGQREQDRALAPQGLLAPVLTPQERMEAQRQNAAQRLAETQVVGAQQRTETQTQQRATTAQAQLEQRRIEAEQKDATTRYVAELKAHQAVGKQGKNTDATADQLLKTYSGYWDRHERATRSGNANPDQYLPPPELTTVINDIVRQRGGLSKGSAGATQDNPVQVATQDMAKALPSGAWFMRPDGIVMQKK